MKNETCANGIVSFELVEDIKVSKNIVNSWNKESRDAAMNSLRIDFPFIIIYVLFLLLVLSNIMKKMATKTWVLITKIMSGFVILAGGFDIFENINLMKILNGVFIQKHASNAYFFASNKFLILGMVVIYIVVFYLGRYFSKHKNSSTK